VDKTYALVFVPGKWLGSPQQQVLGAGAHLEKMAASKEAVPTGWPTPKVCALTHPIT
jgi:hypothetical protein